MALPLDPVERMKKLEKIHEDSNKLATWIQGNYPQEVEKGGTAGEIAIRIITEQDIELGRRSPVLR